MSYNNTKIGKYISISIQSSMKSFSDCKMLDNALQFISIQINSIQQKKNWTREIVLFFNGFLSQAYLNKNFTIEAQLLGQKKTSAFLSDLEKTNRRKGK